MISAVDFCHKHCVWWVLYHVYFLIVPNWLVTGTACDVGKLFLNFVQVHCFDQQCTLVLLSCSVFRKKIWSLNVFFPRVCCNYHINIYFFLIMHFIGIRMSRQLGNSTLGYSPLNKGSPIQSREGGSSIWSTPRVLRYTVYQNQY